MNYELIKFIRTNLRMNQNEFSVFLGVSRSEIGLVEAGYRDASDKLVKAIHEKVDHDFIKLVKEVIKRGKQEMP